jgi:hypothetical protein
MLKENDVGARRCGSLAGAGAWLPVCSGPPDWGQLQLLAGRGGTKAEFHLRERKNAAASSATCSGHSDRTMCATSGLVLLQGDRRGNHDGGTAPCAVRLTCVLGRFVLWPGVLGRGSQPSVAGGAQESSNSPGGTSDVKGWSGKRTQCPVPAFQRLYFCQVFPEQ